MLDDGSGGAVIFLDYDDTIFNRYHKLTGGAQNAFKGELVAILLAIRLVQELEIPACRPVFIVSDCQSAIQASLSPKRDNFFGTFIFDELQSSCAINNLVWIPSHVGIPGNDAAAMPLPPTAGQDTFSFDVPTDLAFWKSRIKGAAFEFWACEWNHNVCNCPSLHDILPALRHRPNFLLDNNRLDKQLARIRMDYIPLTVSFTVMVFLITALVMVVSASMVHRLYNLPRMFFSRALFMLVSANLCFPLLSLLFT